MEHGDQLTGGEVVWVGKETARKDLQRKVPSRLWKAESIKEVRRTLAVIAGERAREIDVQQFESRRHVHSNKITKPKRWALQHERCDVQRRCPRDRGEGVGVTVGQDQRIVHDSHQRLQIGIDSPKQCPKVVVLPEERMKPAAHRDLIIAMRHRPGTHPTTELVMRLDHDHWNAPFGQPNGGRYASNAAAGHDDRLGGRPSTGSESQMPCRPAPRDDGLREHHGQVASRRHGAG